MYRKQGYFCQSCGLQYPGEPVDATEHDLPLDDDERGPDHQGRPVGREHQEVLDDLVDATSPPTRTAAKVRELPGRRTSVGKRLVQLEDDGLAKKHSRSSSSGDWWEPTEAGLDAADGGQA
jgi:hypothetical protein